MIMLHFSGRTLKMAVETTTYWDGKAPDSIVLGPFLSKVPSTVLGPASLVALVVGAVSVHNSNIFNTLTLENIEPQYILASFLCPISWGLHVAAWIQKKNGK